MDARGPRAKPGRWDVNHDMNQSARGPRAEPDRWDVNHDMNQSVRGPKDVNAAMSRLGLERGEHHAATKGAFVRDAPPPTQQQHGSNERRHNERRPPPRVPSPTPDEAETPPGSRPSSPVPVQDDAEQVRRSLTATVGEGVLHGVPHSSIAGLDLPPMDAERAENATNPPSHPSTPPPAAKKVLPPNYVCPYALKHGDNMNAQVFNWLSDVTAQELDMAEATEEGMYKLLRSGVLLCELANALVPGTVPRIERKLGAFQMRENIARFIGGAKQIGVPTNELFDTPDLFEGKRMRQVKNCLFALGRICHDIDGYTGPCLGKPIKHKTGAHKNSQFQVKANEGLWGKSNGAHRPDAGGRTSVRSVTPTGR